MPGHQSNPPRSTAHGSITHFIRTTSAYTRNCKLEISRVLRIWLLICAVQLSEALRVGSQQQWQSIQAAVDAAAPGATILIEQGT